MITTTPTPTPTPPVIIPLHCRALRRAKRLAKSAAKIYLLVSLVLYALQTKLIFPGASTQGTPDAIVTPLPNTELLHLTAADPANTPIVALFGKATLKNGTTDPRAASRPTLLYFYGNGMCLADSLAEFNLFRSLGANCIAVEYAGFGMSGGTPGEAGCYLAGEAAYQHLLTRTDIDTRKLIPAGWSLGGAVAIDLAHKHRSENRIIALITFCTFTSMPEMARYHYPMFPTSLVIAHKFASLEKLPDLHLPHFLAHGTHDSIIPFSHANQLAKAIQGPLTRFTADTDHNDFFEIATPALTPELKKFLDPF